MINWKCPYCGFINKQRLDTSSPMAYLRYCDSDEGGCDKQVVVKVQREIKTIAYKISDEHEVLTGA